MSPWILIIKHIFLIYKMVKTNITIVSENNKCINAM